jgi:hypothetical protein
MYHKDIFQKIARMGAAAIVGAMLVGVTMSSCEKDDDGLFVPPADLTTSEMVQLVEDANEMVKEAPLLTLNGLGSETDNGATYTLAAEAQYDRAGKTHSHTKYFNSILAEFTFVDNTTLHSFTKAESQADFLANKYTEKKAKRTIAPDDSYFSYGEDFVSGLNSPSYTWSWKVEGSALVGTQTANIASTSSRVSTYEITLGADRRYKNITHTATYTYAKRTEISVATVRFSYDAAPSLSLFSTSEFEEELGWNAKFADGNKKVFAPNLWDFSRPHFIKFP